VTMRSALPNTNGGALAENDLLKLKISMNAAHECCGKIIVLFS
jgi:hypothetical protein